MNKIELWHNREECCGCGACMSKCPTGAITMQADDEGFLYPFIDPLKCTGCTECLEVCQIHHSPVRQCAQQKYYGARNRDKESRMQSASGGIFPLLAQKVLDNGGIVFGAGMDEGFHVRHQGIDNKSDIALIRQTKYVQSEINLTYAQAREYKGLFLVDLICTGVPSPLFWEKYVAWLEEGQTRSLKAFNFRSKKHPDSGHTVTFQVDETKAEESYVQNLYTTMFVKNLCLRPICHACRFCSLDRFSDITMGDFWGESEKKDPYDDGFGLSTIMVNTDQGQRLWERIFERVDFFQCNFEEIKQPRLIEPSKLTLLRKLFFKDLNSQSMEYIRKKYR